MRCGLYPKLALNSIRKNKRIFLPFIFTCTGMVMMYYIMSYLAAGNLLGSVHGGDIMAEVFLLGSRVIAFFSAIFLFYTNSFLIRQRKKEFGLYNILGMGKRNIAVILFWEMLFIAVISVSAGLFIGIALSKFAELGMVNIAHGEITYALSISVKSVVQCLIVFGIIFVLLLLNSIRQVRFSSAVSLLKSANVGEKPPKGNILLGIAGVLMLAGAYYIAVTITNPAAALAVFFIAVIMVIAATYLIMISGSVVFCRLLQKNKSYYYKPNHFVSVSSMVYRMKRNGAGLASICILATMVLVMISSTTCLYFGEQYSIDMRYPREINTSFRFDSSISEETVNTITDVVDNAVKENGTVPQNVIKYTQASISGLIRDNEVILDVRELNSLSLDTYTNVYQFYFIPVAEYNALSGENEVLSDNEAIMYPFRGNFDGETLSFRGGKTFKITKRLKEFTVSMDSAMMILPSILMVVPDIDGALEGIDTLADYNGNRMVQYQFEYYFDTGLDKEAQININNAVIKAVRNELYKKYYIRYFTSGSREQEREGFYSMYGSLFYLGIMLSVVFIIAAVLIIYYKQVSEGYEDQSRFEIMQKVGMTKRSIRKTINSQLLTVFFLPLVFAAMHIAFAFPILQKLLLLFNLDNVALFAFTTVLSVAAFGIFYAIVYKLTSNVYYKIVSGARETNR